MNKTDKSIARIKEFYREPYYVAFSGGKDSIVVYDLVKKSGVKHDVHFSLTTVDPPELIYFIRDNYPEVEVIKPEKSMWQLIPEKRMPPTRMVRYCCEVLKENGGGGRHVITGIRWEESSKRGKRKMTEVCYKDKTKIYLHPIIDWTEKDVWEYIKNNNLKYPCLYDEGHKRIGCIMCPIATHRGMVRDAKRWPKYYQAYIRSFQRCIDKRIKDGLITNWKTGSEMMEWWLGNHDNNLKLDMEMPSDLDDYV